ncbi:MAG TPA: PaaI family thioesterase [Polyangiaceae bacterium]|nr:PaaI family thioesterase [Polyangiaceae bacterium]
MTDPAGGASKDGADAPAAPKASEAPQHIQAPWADHMGLTYVSIAEQEVVAELVVTPMHYQPMGVVHGGVYCSIVETVCSVGAFLHSSKRGLFVVGVDNQTSFLKATRAGTLRATARPLSVGRRTQLWEANIHNRDGALVATGRVRLVAVEPGSNLGGRNAGELASEK